MPDCVCHRCFAAVLVIGGVLLTGCAAPQAKSPDASAPPPTRPAALSPHDTPLRLERPRAASVPVTIELGRSARRRPIEAVVFEGAEGCVLIVGGIHGDEPVGSPLVGRLAAHLEAHPDGRAGKRIVLIPRANPDGLATGTRWNARGVDLNRNFATGNFRPHRRHGKSPLSEPESRALVAAIARYRPSCVVSVHGPLNRVDADGGDASHALAGEMAAVSPLPLGDLPALSGSLGSYAGNELGLKMITYELDRKDLPERDPAGYLEPHMKPLLLAIARG